MLIAVVGTYTDMRMGSIRGNGKTLTAVYLAYQAHKEGRKIITNFYTDFSEMLTLNEIVNEFKAKNLQNTVVILDEVQTYLMNSGVKVKTLKEIINLFVAQTRKQNVDIIVTTQRYRNLHIQLRTQCDVFLIPFKYHIDKNGNLADLCKLDNCDKQHGIIVYKPEDNEFLPFVLNPERVGKLYNSNEIILDEFVINEK